MSFVQHDNALPRDPKDRKLSNTLLSHAADSVTKTNLALAPTTTTRAIVTTAALGVTCDVTTHRSNETAPRNSVNSNHGDGVTYRRFRARADSGTAGPNE